MKLFKKKKDSDEGEGWDVTLVRFRDNLGKLIFDRQPPEKLSPELVLAAEITKLVKEDLERSVSRIILSGLRPLQFH